jgi:pretoxin HINT domain-containing protein/nucleic acid/nucleotide deaminase of polymorphic system toxin
MPNEPIMNTSRLLTAVAVLSIYVEKDTAFVPVSHAEDKDFFYGHALFWDPETGLCIAVCQGIKMLAQEYYARPGDKDNPWLCGIGIKDCTVDDYEQFIIYHVVDQQKYYDHDGDLLQERKEDISTTVCLDLANGTDNCEINDAVKEVLDKAETIYDVYDLIKEFFRGGNGLPKGCFNSFRGDTQVLMADGSTTAIQDIRPRQLVLAGDPTSRTVAAQPVTAQHINTDTELTDLTLTDGSIIHTTAHHPFWTPKDQKWTDAGSLVSGATLSSTNGITTTVKSVHTFTGAMTMYNLTVDRIHTYYVIAGSTPVLVHNFNCPKKVDYNSASNDLAPRAAEIRYKSGLRDVEHNVAVARVKAPDGSERLIEYVSGAPGHSEERIIDEPKTDDVVIELYSERKPCPDICAPKMQQDRRFDQADITYSIDWHTRSTKTGKALNEVRSAELRLAIMNAWKEMGWI